jgi:hypothetical protein
MAEKSGERRGGKKEKSTGLKTRHYEERTAPEGRPYKKRERCRTGKAGRTGGNELAAVLKLDLWPDDSL